MPSVFEERRLAAAIQCATGSGRAREKPDPAIRANPAIEHRVRLRDVLKQPQVRELSTA